MTARLLTITLPSGCKTTMVFQKDRLLPWLTAKGNVALCAGEAEAERWLTLFGLREDMDEYPAALSGGMCRRVAQARADGGGGPMKLYPYLLVMALVTYLIRMLPLAFFRKKITSPFLLGVLHYMPYAVLGTMTVPAIFTSTGAVIPSVVGFLAALLLGFKRRSLIEVALAATAAAYVTSLVLPLL